MSKPRRIRRSLPWWIATISGVIVVWWSRGLHEEIHDHETFDDRPNELASPTPARSAPRAFGIAVIDDRGRPVPTARLELEGNVVRSVDQRGRVELLGGIHRGVARAPGHVSTEFDVALGPDEEEGCVVLARLGRLRLRIANEHDEPVAGIRVTIVPPLLSGEPFGSEWRQQLPPMLDGMPAPTRVLLRRVLADGSEWRGVSADDGSIELGGFHPGPGYRYGILSDGIPCDLAPPHEAEPVTKLPSGDIVYRSDESRPVGLSGEFAVAPGEATELDVLVYEKTGVVGRIYVPGETLEDVQLRLVSIEPHDSDGDGLNDWTHKRAEIIARGEADGFFSLMGLRGNLEKELIGHASTRNGGVAHYWPVSRRFFCPLGQIYELGDVVPLRDPAIRGVIEFGTPDGEPIDPTRIFAEPPRFARARLSFQPPGRRDGYTAGFPIELGVPFVLHGAVGATDLRVDAENNWPEPRLGYRLSPPEPATLRPESGELVRIRFLAEETRRVELRFSFALGEVCPFRYFVRHESGEMVRRWIHSVDSETSAISEYRWLAVGAHEIYVHTNSPFHRGESLFAMKRFVVPSASEGDATPVEVAITPGNILEIEARAIDGSSPLREIDVSLALVRPNAPDEPLWLFSSPTDASGVATFYGIPPNALLYTHLDPEVRLSSGPPGSVMTYEVYGTEW